MKYLVLGGSGFVGKRLCTALANQGHEVLGFSRGVISVPRGVEWVQGDFSDSGLIHDVLQGVDVVYHLISTTLPATSNRDVNFDLLSNVLPTLHMLQSARDRGVKKVIFTSSGGAVYGVPERHPIQEDDATNPICAYGVHKLAIEKYLELYRHSWGMDYGVLRIANAYGEDHVINQSHGAVTQFIHNATNHKPIEIWGDGSTLRDYVHVDDVVEALLLLLDNSSSHRIFNVGSGRGHTLLDLISIIEKTLNRSVDVHFSEARTVDVPRNVLDISRAGSVLGWYPRKRLEDSVRQMLGDSGDSESAHSRT